MSAYSGSPSSSNLSRLRFAGREVDVVGTLGVVRELEALWDATAIKLGRALEDEAATGAL